MGSIGRRQGRGCDCRDTEEYDNDTQGESFACCTECPVEQRPCKWIARFPCFNITFAQCCPFTDGCGYVGTNVDGFADMPDAWCTWDYLYRIHYGTNSDPCGTLDWLYELDIETKTVTYSPSGSGQTATWTLTGDWNCTEPNNLELTDADGITGLPKFLCVVPSEELQLPFCEDHYVSGSGPGSLDDVGYDDDTERCACADGGCPQTHTLWLRCDECYESDTQTISATIPGIGVECDNPSYTMTSVLCSQTLVVTWYCCGGDWLADVTLNSNFCGTYPVPRTSSCPLVLGPGTSACDLSYYLDCDAACIGIDAECELPTCCAEFYDDQPDDPFAGSPVVLDAAFVPIGTCYGSTAEFTGSLTYDSGADEWSGNVTNGTDTFAVTATCSGGTWTVLATAGAEGCSFTVVTMSEVDCPSLLLTGTGSFGSDPTCGGCSFNFAIAA